MWSQVLLLFQCWIINTLSGYFLESRVPVPHPDLVFPQVGENEVGYTDPFLIIRNILSICMVLLQNGVSNIMVGALVPRLSPRHVSISQYTRRIRYINLHLNQALINMPRVSFHGLVGFCPRYLHADGVHFNSRGQRWFM
ncbi:hypothetical protein ACJMK2_002076 [Sinanodonta woodiana]|uniref:Uncharacterized protein n=1 Tax=Sinanodonta woodiana TaxID=1069815 RepID=A0ABD3XXB4_SINWO